MTSTPSPSIAADVYHDYYDLALMPISLGDIITWGVKSAMRAEAAGRKRVHVHLVCDKNTGLSHFHNKSYAVDHFTFEILPAFSSHPYYSGITAYSSRDQFESMVPRLIAGDPLNLENYDLHRARLKKRGSADAVNKDFRELCSKHDDINESFARTGRYPKPEALPDFIHDLKTLKAEFPEDTFWVTVQFRLRMLDTGMPITNAPDAFLRDAPFVHWHHFLKKAVTKYPHVRFIILGRLQEKPLEILRLPNVVALRTLGMTIGHEFAALLDSDLFMGSPSGFAQLAHFSDVPYEIFNCTPGGCLHYDIPFGAPQLPIASPRQRLHYGVEDSSLLLDTLGKAIGESPRKIKNYEVFQTAKTSTTHRFFINDEQATAEISNNLTSEWQKIAFLLESGRYPEARAELTVVEEAFPTMISDDPKYEWLFKLVGHFCGPSAAPGDDEKWQEKSHAYELELSSYLHPRRLVRQSGRFIYEVPLSTGMNRDGWCQKEVSLIFGPSVKGNFFMIQFARLASDIATSLSVRLNDQPAANFTLLNEPCLIEVPILTDSVQTKLELKFGSSCLLNSRESQALSAQIDRAGIALKQVDAPTQYVRDKADPVRGPSSGIYTTGSASSHAWIRIDNPYPEDQEIRIEVIAIIPKKLRKGQDMVIQVNDAEKHRAFISGKHLEASIPCPGRPRHINVTLEFTDPHSSSAYDLEGRAEIRSITILPSQIKAKAFIRSGLGGFVSYTLRRLKSKRRSRS